MVSSDAMIVNRHARMLQMQRISYLDISASSHCPADELNQDVPARVRNAEALLRSRSTVVVGPSCQYNQITQTRSPASACTMPAMEGANT